MTSVDTSPNDPELYFKVYFDDSMFFLSHCNATATVQEFMAQLEIEYGFLFNEPVSIFCLQDSVHADVPRTLELHYLASGDADLADMAPAKLQRQPITIYPIRNIVSCTPLRLNIHVLTVPQVSTLEHAHPKEQGYKHPNPTRCKPYCTPLAKFGHANEVCAKCGEVKAYLPIVGGNCTQFCYSSDTRKQKSQQLDFCSICLGRLRKGLYTPSAMHQCCVCHRPWLILSANGICRTCHGLLASTRDGSDGARRQPSGRDTARSGRQRSKGGDAETFRPMPIIVNGPGAVDPTTLPEVQESRRLGVELFKNYNGTGRILDLQ